MRIVTDGYIHTYGKGEFNEQLQDALRGIADTNDGIAAISKLLHHVVMRAEIQHSETLHTYEIAAVMKMVQECAKRAADDVYDLDEALSRDEVKKALEKCDAFDFKNYASREMTAAEECEDNAQFLKESTIKNPTKK